MDSPRRARPARRSRHRLGRPSVKPLPAASLCRLRLADCSGWGEVLVLNIGHQNWQLTIRGHVRMHAVGLLGVLVLFWSTADTRTARMVLGGYSGTRPGFLSIPSSITASGCGERWITARGRKGAPPGTQGGDPGIAIRGPVFATWESANPADSLHGRAVRSTRRIGGRTGCGLVCGGRTICAGVRRGRIEHKAGRSRVDNARSCDRPGRSSA